jgi:diacylglycerol kinase (ATP)
MTFAVTRARGDATDFVREALADGHLEIIAVGGDGTINEAMNGFFDAEGPIAPDAVFGFVTSGTGGDFRKTFGIAPGYAAAIARLKEAPVRADRCRPLSCLSRNGEPVVRYFINIGSFGMSGVIVDGQSRAHRQAVRRHFRLRVPQRGGMLSYRDRTVRIRVDGDYDEIASISTVAVANGQYFGGGMRVAPNAHPDDGLFDVIVMGGAPKSRALAELKQIYTGDHLKNPSVRVVRGRKVTAAPVAETRGRAVLIEVDGESAGRLPATFEILPRALNLRC